MGGYDLGVGLRLKGRFYGLYGLGLYLRELRDRVWIRLRVHGLYGLGLFPIIKGYGLGVWIRIRFYGLGLFPSA